MSGPLFLSLAGWLIDDGRFAAAADQIAILAAVDAVGPAAGRLEDRLARARRDAAAAAGRDR